MTPISRHLACMAVVFLAVAAAGGGQEPGAGTDTSTNGFDPDDLPTVAAVVDGREIPRAELITEARNAYDQLVSMGAQPEMNRGFYAEALNQILAGLLLHAEAERLGVAATDDEIATEMDRLRAQFESEDAFQLSLAQQGISENKARRDIQEQISIQKYLVTQIRPTITITEEEARTFYGENLDKMPDLEEGVKVHHILKAATRDAPDDEQLAARESIQGLLTRARSGEDFAALARETSDDGNAANGGELPWIGRGQTLPEFEAAAFALQPGQLSDVVRTDAGFHVIMCVDTQEAGKASFEIIRPRIEDILAEPRMNAAMIQAIADLEAKASVERFF